MQIPWYINIFFIIHSLTSMCVFVFYPIIFAYLLGKFVMPYEYAIVIGIVLYIIDGWKHYYFKNHGYKNPSMFYKL